MKAYNKEWLLKFGIDNKIECPITYFHNDIEELLDNVEKFPVVIKPSLRHGVQIEICNNSSELKKKYNAMTNRYGPCIVQDYIPNGGELGVYTLFNNEAKPIAVTVHKRIRSLFPYGGMSTLRESIKNDQIIEIAFNLLKKIKWSNVAMVEFRIDSRDGVPKLIEINPRFWGSLQLSILSGVDFPHLLYKMTTGDNISPCLDFREGVQCRWFSGDIAGFFQCPNKLKNLRDFFRFKKHYDILSLDDPKPMIVSIFPPWDTRGAEHWEHNIRKN
jgi:predicted ATP-grasp superfamily ATP-dependent carboligase